MSDTIEVIKPCPDCEDGSYHGRHCDTHRPCTKLHGKHAGAEAIKLTERQWWFHVDCDQGFISGTINESWCGDPDEEGECAGRFLLVEADVWEKWRLSVGEDA